MREGAYLRANVELVVRTVAVVTVSDWHHLP